MIMHLLICLESLENGVSDSPAVKIGYWLEIRQCDLVVKECCVLTETINSTFIHVYD